MRIATIILLILLTGFVSAAAAEQGRSPAPFSVAVSAGQARVDNNAYDRSTIYSLQLQYDILPLLTVAIGGHQFDKFKVKGSSNSLSLTAMELSVLTGLYLDNGVAIQPRIGYMAYEAEAKTPIGTLKDDGYTLTAGLTVRFPILSSRRPHLGVIADARRAFSVSKATIDWLTLGLYIGF